MKQILCLSIVLSLGINAAHSETKKSDQLHLEIQKSAALPAHLTTRISWEKFPQPKYAVKDLQSQDRSAIVRVYADETGKVTKAAIQESTGLANLDEILLVAVRKAKVKPPIEDETPVATIGYQTFNLTLPKNGEKNCNFTFQSKNWIAQNSEQKTPFKYLQQPQININTKDLNGHNRSIDFKFKINKHGNVKKVNITQGSGSYELDQKIVQAILNSQVEVKRSAWTLWLYKKSTLKDSIQFNLKECK